MFNLRNLLIVATGAAAFAGLQSSKAQACDNDRFPCPVITEAAPLESPDAAAAPAPTAQPRKKADHSTKPAAAQNAAPKAALATQPRKQADRPARGGEKAQAKVARAAPGGATGLKTDKPEVPEAVIAPTAQSHSVAENPGEAPLAGISSNNSTLVWLRLRERTGRLSLMPRGVCRPNPRLQMRRKVLRKTQYKWSRPTKSTRSIKPPVPFPQRRRGSPIYC